MKKRNIIFLTLLIVALIGIGLIAKPDISTVSNGVLTSIIASLLFLIFTTLIDNSSDEIKSGIQDLKKQLLKVNEYIDASPSNLREKLGIIRIENRREYSYDFWTSFLKEALIEKSSKFIISGKTLHRWLEAEIVDDFKKSLIKMIAEKVKIGFVIYSEPENPRRKEELREFLFQEIFPHLVSTCGRDLAEIYKVFNIFEVSSLPFQYAAIDSQIVVAQYFNNASNAENIMLVLSSECTFAHRYQEDFNAINKCQNTWIETYLQQTERSQK